MRRAFILFFLLFYCTSVSHAQPPHVKAKIDSLQRILDTSPSDTQQVRLLNELATQRWDYRPEQAKKDLENALSKAEATNYLKGLAITHNKMGYARSEESQYAEALQHYQKSLSYYKQLGATVEQIDIYNQIGRIYDGRGAHTKALENYLTSQQLSERIGDTKRLAVIRGNIGIIYSKLEDEEKALALFAQSVRDHKASGSTSGLATTYINMGVSHQKIGNLEAAEDNYQNALTIFQEQNDTRGLAFAYGNLGDLLLLRSEPEEALRFYEKSKPLFEKLKEQNGIAMSQTQVGIAQLLLDRFRIAEQSLQRGLRLAREVGARDVEKDALYYLSQCAEFRGDHKTALRYFHEYERLKDELRSLEKSKALVEMRTQYELQQLEEEYASQQAEQREKHQSEIARQQLVVLGATGMLIILFILGVLQYFRIREKNMTNRILSNQHDKIAAQRDAIEKQNQALHRKNNQISQSIRSAKAIQQALLPPPSKMQELFQDYFVLYRPKDVVSGDFFWVGQAGEWRYLAMVDCTGHGVPGAFMSLIGNTLLDKIILLRGLRDPSQILEELHQEVYQSLHQKDNTENSGMDAALVALRQHPDKADYLELHFSGAKRPLWFFSNGKLEGYNGDRRAIGGQRSVKAPFTTHTVELQHGDLLYLFSDGYADQHNEKRRKIGTRRMRDLISELARKPDMDQQKAALITALDVHQGKQDQRDDILVMSVRI